jgi:hypothetical protein
MLAKYYTFHGDKKKQSSLLSRSPERSRNVCLSPYKNVRYQARPTNPSSSIHASYGLRLMEPPRPDSLINILDAQAMRNRNLGCRTETRRLQP